MKEQTKEHITSIKEVEVNGEVPEIKKIDLLDVLFGGKNLDETQRFIIRSEIVGWAMTVKIRPARPTKQLSDRELILRYLKDENSDLAFDMLRVCSPNPNTLIYIMICFLIIVGFLIRLIPHFLSSSPH